MRLQEAALARQFDVLLVMDLSRLSRSMGDLAHMIDRLTFVGLRIVGVHDGFDNTRDGHELVSGLSGIMGQQFRKMVAKKTYVALESRAKSKRPTGGRAYGYRDGKVDRGEAFIVNEIFGKFADGASCRTIAAELNARRIPSPGASWDRMTRRPSGWMGSGVRVIVRNERYCGVIHWNTSEWRKNPVTGMRKRVARPKSEWITHADESRRIVSDRLWARAQDRMRGPQISPARSGGKPKYLLSGLLRCGVCDAHYIGVNAHHYGCSSHRDGGSCTNGVRVKRTEAEAKMAESLLDALTPENVQVTAREMQAYWRELERSREVKAIEAPHELQELSARIARLRERLRIGDPDMPTDELQAAIDRAEAKRRELLEQQPAAKESAKVLKMLPKAAESARRELVAALAGDSRASLKARVILRNAYEGEAIRLVPDEDGHLDAHWKLQTVKLLCSAVVGTGGSGGRI